MKKLFIASIAVFCLILSVFSILVLAKPDTGRVPAANNKGNVDVLIPAHAVQVADNVFSLGTAQDVDGRVVEGIMHVYKKNHAKPGTVCGNGLCESGENSKKCPADCGNGGGDPVPTSSCFTLLAKGAKWKTTEPYVTDAGVSLTDTESSLETWDSEVAFDVFGVGSSGITDGRDEVAPDGVNEVDFGPLGDPNTIAVTITWGVFRGNPANRELVEWDATFNTAYPFGDGTSDVSVMDYKNIATHEFGHALGLGHPDSTCTEETMYAFAALGETKKRSLEAGDLAGVNELYS